MKNSTQTKFNAARVPKRHEADLSRVKQIVRKAAALFVFAMFVACAATPAMAAGLMKITDIQGGGGASKQEGSGAASKYVPKSPDRTIYFGNYWQNPVEGHAPAETYYTPEEFDAANWKKEGIKWRVLSNDQTGRGNMLLLSDQGLYADKFNNDNSNNMWVSSDIRATLTGLNKKEVSTGKAYNQLDEQSFAHDAFNAKEYAAIADTTHKAGGSNTGGDKESIDKLFLLSKEEATNTDYGFTDGTGATDTRIAYPTAFAKSVKMYGGTHGVLAYDSGATTWWLRSPGDTGSDAYFVSYGGSVGGTGVDGYSVAVRAAFNLNQESVLFLSAAVGGKTSVAVGNGFKLEDYTGADGWKVTLNDGSIVAPTAVTVTQKMTRGVDDLAKAATEGGTVDLTNGVTANYGAPIVTYTATAISETDSLKKADCVSAILVSGDKYINYAKISAAASETDKEVPFGDLTNGTYKMLIFAEKENGEKQTDYASAFSNKDGYEFTKGIGTVYTGNLSKAYKDKNITVNLGGGFDLGFENAEYATKVIVADDNPDNKITGGVSDAKPAGFMAAIDTILGTEIASETDGTMLGKVTVNESAALACCGKIISMDLTLNPNSKLTIENDAVVELHEIETGEGSAIYMEKTGTLINQSGEDITVQHVKEDGTTEEVTVKSGYSYKPSAGDPQPVTPEPTESKGGGSSVGCNAGFGIAMLLSAAAAMLCKRKRG
ncbi:MAG: DUF6273 domain-containing protein [Synergistes sp.]|nr:DUF6273 domain-containing protein [Synergistes sp.]